MYTRMETDTNTEPNPLNLFMAVWMLTAIHIFVFRKEIVTSIKHRSFELKCFHIINEIEKVAQNTPKNSPHYTR